MKPIQRRRNIMFVHTSMLALDRVFTRPLTCAVLRFVLRAITRPVIRLGTHRIAQLPVEASLRELVHTRVCDSHRCPAINNTQLHHPRHGSKVQWTLNESRAKITRDASIGYLNFLLEGLEKQKQTQSIPTLREC